MAGFSSGGTSDAPTWQYVQNVIATNISKSEDAVSVAYSYLDQIARRYQDIQNDVPTDWFVDVNIGTDTNVNWTNPIVQNDAPVEPDYSSNLPNVVEVAQTNVPSSLRVQAQPEWDLESGTAPESPGTLEYSALPTLGALPTIDVPIPPLDIGLLDTEFSFNESAYAVQVSDESKENILRVLGGDMGIPQAYWDDMWAKVAGDLAEQQVGLARNARNRGAATHWGLPTEAVLAAGRAVQDEGNKKLQLVRIEQAQKQAELAHDDFWKAIEQAIQFEKMFIDFHNQTQTRALTAAQHLATTAIQVYNANVGKYNALLEAAKLSSQVLSLKAETVLKKYAAQLQQNKAELEQNKNIIDVFSAEVQAYSISEETQIRAIAEKTKWWNSQWESHARYEALKQEKSKLDLANYEALLSRISTLGSATATLLQARTGVSAFQLSNQAGILDQEKAKNIAAIDVSKMTQAAQEAESRLQIAQTQWLGGQGNALLQNLSQSAIGLAQALITVSDVNLGSTAGVSDTNSVSASRNAEKVW